MHQRLQVGLGIRICHIRNLLSSGAEELLKLRGPLFAELSDGPAAQLGVNPFWFRVLAHCPLRHRHVCLQLAYWLTPGILKPPRWPVKRATVSD